MREDRGDNRYNDCEYGDDHPEANHIGRIEIPTLDHLKHPDQIESKIRLKLTKDTVMFFLDMT